MYLSTGCAPLGSSMTAIVEFSEDGRPPDDEARPNPPAGILERFDLLDRLGVGIARFADVELPERGATAPRINARLLKDAATTVLTDPAKKSQRKVLVVFASIVAVFSALVGSLLVTGRLGDFYRAIWSRFPGRPWTHVMRDHPWIYLVLAAGLAIVPFLLAPRGRWGRAFLTYVIFLIGFLGGHVFW
jgi:hypothetical protein